MANVYNLINELDGAVNSFQDNINVHVRNVDTTTQRVQATTNQVYQKVSQFRDDLMKGEEKQIAHENIIRLDQVVKEQFGNYEAIRKTIIGIVRDFDINLVRNSTIEELSEELWITSSRYWLSYALIAVTAWVNNYPEVAKNALSEGSRKDAIKTSLFFCLLNLRFDRIETSKNWFKAYCRTLDPTMLQQETAVMIQAFLNGIFGKDKELEYEVIKILDEWISIISEDAQICEQLVNAYYYYVQNLGVKAKFDYQFIANFCTNNEEVQKAFNDVSKFQQIIEMLKSLDVDGEIQTDENYKARVDAILTNLITNYDKEELEVKNQQQYYRMVVENEGNVEVAEAQYQQFEELQNESFNIGKQMVEWVIYGEQTNTDVQVRKFGLQSTREWFKTAINKWSADTKANCPLQYNISIDGWEGVSNARDLDEQTTSMKNYFENNKFRMVCVNSLNIAAVVVFFIALAITVGSIVSIVNFGFTPVIFVGIVLMLASAGFVAYRIINGFKKFGERVETALQNLAMTISQIVDFQRYFSENINKKDEILSIVEFI